MVSTDSIRHMLRSFTTPQEDPLLWASTYEAGALVGSLVYMSLTSGMNLIGVDISLQYIVRGAVLAAAVIFDVSTRRNPR